MFLQSPGFSIAAVAALALGIGANTAIFSIINAVLLKPVPLPDADRLVVFQTSSPEGAFNAASPAKFQHWREQTAIVSDVSAYTSNVVNLTAGGFPEQIRAARVSAGYFRLFGAEVFRGRTFTADEDRPGGERVVVLATPCGRGASARIRASSGSRSRLAAIRMWSSASSARPSICRISGPRPTSGCPSS
jgi:putative ABC transport system permease protein